MPEPPADAAQPLIGFLSNDEWQALLAGLNEQVEWMEALPHDETRQRVFELLNAVDAVHREALRRLVRLFKEGVLEKVISDPAIHTLMELYDLLPASAEAEPPSPAGPTGPKFRSIPIRVVADRPKAPLRYPHWVPALANAGALAPGTLRTDIVVDGLPLLLARHGDEWFALDALCPVDGSSLDGATLSAYMLSCPNHAGCHFDIRNGARIGGGPSLACHPVKVDEGGRVLAGLDMDFTPSLPAF